MNGLTTRCIGASVGAVALATVLGTVSWVDAQTGADPHRRQDSGAERMMQQVASIQAMAPVGEKVVYAGSFGAGMFRSDDRGATWTADGEGLTDAFILSMAVGQDGTVYVGTFRGGVFRRKPSASAWEAVNDGLKRFEVKALLISSGQVYAGTADGVYRMKEGTGTWAAVSTGTDDILVHAVGRASDGTLFAGTSGKGVLRHREGASAKPKGGREKSDPKQSGWVRLRQGLKDHEGLVENYIRVITMSPTQELYIGTFDGGVFHSVDHGDTWRPISRALPNDSIRAILSSDRQVIVATGRGIFKTENNGQKWVPLNKGLTELSIQSLVAAGSRTLYAGTSGGAFRSDDEGGSWVPINDGLGVPSDVPFTFQ